MTRPRYNIDLGAHLRVCDRNYARLTRLLPGLERGPRRRTFRIAQGDLAPLVKLAVTSRTRYTTVLSLRREAAGGVGEVRITVRLYHDTRSAEVIEFQGCRNFKAVYDYPNASMRQPDEKAQVNRFLGEFLHLCLSHGVASAEPLAIG